jgi:hypothetical protein
MIRCFYAAVAWTLAASIAIFFHTVAMWPVFKASLVFIGMLLTFLLGLFTGTGLLRRRRPSPPAMALNVSDSPQTDRPELLTSRR